MEKINIDIAKVQSKDAAKEIKNILFEEAVLDRETDIHIGFINEIFVKDIKTKDGNTFQQIILAVIDSDGKRYEKKYSVDFARKYFNQIGYKAAELFNAVVAFKVKDKYKNLGYFSFVASGDDEAGTYYGLAPYKDEESIEMLERLKKLGI